MFLEEIRLQRVCTVEKFNEVDFLRMLGKQKFKFLKKKDVLNKQYTGLALVLNLKKIDGIFLVKNMQGNFSIYSKTSQAEMLYGISEKPRKM